MKPLKIIYVAMKYDYGDKARGYSFEHENFYKALKRMGNSIIYFDFYTLMQKYGEKRMNALLWKSVQKNKPDLLFCVLFKDEINKKIIEKISKDTTTTTFNWFCDDHWRFDVFSKHWAPYFNYVSTTDKDSLKKYKQIGYKNVILTQWACNHYDYKKLNLPKKYDVTFIGQPHGVRKEWINNLKESGVNIKCWGYGWNKITSNILFRTFWYIPKRLPLFNKVYKQIVYKINSLCRLSQRDMIKVINQSKINLNISNSSVNAPQQIKGRNFEIPGCGGFLVTNYVKYLEDYYNVDKEVVCFNSWTELKNKIHYYLKHKGEREKIAFAGYKRTLKYHTYEKRFNEIFKKIGLV